MNNNVIIKSNVKNLPKYTTVRITTALHTRLKEIANKEERTIGVVISRLLKSILAK